MRDMNVVILIGRVVRDAEMKKTNNGLSLASISIAVQQDKEKAHFVDVTVWGKTAEAIGQYLVKGKRICIRGRLRQDTWTQDGKNRSAIKVDADDVQLLDSAAPKAAAAAGEQTAEQPPLPANDGEIPF